MSVAGLAYAGATGRVYFDAERRPLADGGRLRLPEGGELIPAPPGAVTTLLPGRVPLLADGTAGRRTALAVLLPAGYTRLLLPAYRTKAGAPPLPLFGYTFACVVDDELYVAATRTDASEDWSPRSFAPGELEALVAGRCAEDAGNRVLAQVGLCSLEYGCFTAQNVFLERGEAALPVSPKCNARCAGCISELEPEGGIPSPQTRIVYETSADELSRSAQAPRARAGRYRFIRARLRRRAAPSLDLDRARDRANSGRDEFGHDQPEHQRQFAGLAGNVDRCGTRRRARQLELFPARCLRGVLSSARLRPRRRTRERAPRRRRRAARFAEPADASGHHGRTREVEASDGFLERVHVGMVQTRTLNIDPERYFALTGRPAEPLGMRFALARLAHHGARLGNFTHAH